MEICKTGKKLSYVFDWEFIFTFEAFMPDFKDPHARGIIQFPELSSFSWKDTLLDRYQMRMTYKAHPHEQAQLDICDAALHSRAKGSLLWSIVNQVSKYYDEFQKIQPVFDR